MRDKKLPITANFRVKDGCASQPVLQNKNRPYSTGSIICVKNLFEITTIVCNGKNTEGGWPPSAFLCERHIPLNERTMPHLCLLRINVQAEKYMCCSLLDWRLLKVSTNAGFAIDSPGVPRIVCASDQIRALRVIASNVYLNHYILLFVVSGHKLVANFRKRLHYLSGFLTKKPAMSAAGSVSAHRR